MRDVRAGASTGTDRDIARRPQVDLNLLLQLTGQDLADMGITDRALRLEILIWLRDERRVLARARRPCACEGGR